jgi:hypothetical protein
MRLLEDISELFSAVDRTQSFILLIASHIELIVMIVLGTHHRAVLTTNLQVTSRCRT